MSDINAASVTEAPHLFWAVPSSKGGNGSGGSVDVLRSGVWRTGLREGSETGDFAREGGFAGSWIVVSAWGGGGGTWMARLGGTGGEGSGGGSAGEEDEDSATWSSALGPSGGNCAAGGGWVSSFANESFSSCGGSAALAGRDGAELEALFVNGRGDAAPPALARAAASAAMRSFFLRVSSAPKLELRGRREEGGERLAARLMWELPPAPEEVCLLVREWEEERREE